MYGEERLRRQRERYRVRRERNRRAVARLTGWQDEGNMKDIDTLQ